MEDDLKEIKELITDFVDKYNTEVQVIYDDNLNVYVSAKLKV